MSLARCSLFSLILMAWLIATTANAESPDATEARSKLSFHAFATQAYAWTNGPQLLGIPDNGTSDYRNIAVQGRYDLTQSDTVVLQLAHSRSGKSPTQEFKDDVEFDWGFYEHRFADSTRIRAGRVPIPFGIFNEIRDVGTILPFFAPPFSVYSDTSFTSEAIDGVVVARNFFTESPWSLEVQAYYGAFNSLESFAGLGTAEARFHNSLGAQIWADTPLSGLRLGLAYQQYEVSGGISRINDRDPWSTFLLSADGDFDRFVFRGEYFRKSMTAKVFGIPLPNIEGTGFYLQAGIKEVLPGLSAFVQYETQDFDVGLPGVASIKPWLDSGLCLKYDFNTRLTLKVEYHDNRGFWREDAAQNVFFLPPSKTHYSIVSLSATF